MKEPADLPFPTRLIVQGSLITLTPQVASLSSDYSDFRWHMHLSLPYPFPSTECMKREVTIEQRTYSVGIHNHFDRVIYKLRNGEKGPEYFRVRLEDKRKPVEAPVGAIQSRETLQSVAIFQDQKSYDTANAAFAQADKKIPECLEWLGAFLSQCQREAPYLVSWLVYPISSFDAGTIFHDVSARSAKHDAHVPIFSGASISLGRQLQRPVFSLALPATTESETPFDAANELLAESQMSLFRGMPRLTVLNSYTAAESLANAVFVAMQSNRYIGFGVPEDKAKQLADEERNRHKTEPRFLFHQGMKDAAGRSLLDENKAAYDELMELQKLRHQVAHTGLKPDRETARSAHRLCCEVVRWLTEVSGRQPKPMLPTGDALLPGFSANLLKDAQTQNPGVLEFVRHLLAAADSQSPQA